MVVCVVGRGEGVREREIGRGCATTTPQSPVESCLSDNTARVIPHQASLGRSAQEVRGLSPVKLQRVEQVTFGSSGTAVSPIYKIPIKSNPK